MLGSSIQFSNSCRTQIYGFCCHCDQYIGSVDTDGSVFSACLSLLAIVSGCFIGSKSKC